MRILAIITGILLGGAAQAHEHPGMLVFAGGAIHVHATWTAGPQTPEESVLKLEWRNANSHQPMDPGAFEVSLWMPSMGHGSAPTRISRTRDAEGNTLVGVYEVSNIYFTMGGDWEVRVTLTHADGSKETQAMELTLGGGHDGGHGGDHGGGHHH